MSEGPHNCEDPTWHDDELRFRCRACSHVVTSTFAATVRDTGVCPKCGALTDASDFDHRRFQQDGDPIDIRLDDDEIHGYGEEE